MSEKIFKEAIEAILKGDTDKATDVAKRGLDEGLDPLALMEQGFIPGINQVGDLFETGRLFLPQLVYSSTALRPMGLKSWILGAMCRLSVLLMRPKSLAPILSVPARC
jgi:methanogenic corrinoid protein MtbC1